MIKVDIQLFGGRGSSFSNRKGENGDTQKEYEKQILKDKLKEKIAEVNDYVEKHAIDGTGLTSGDYEEYIKLHKEAEDIKYELETKYFKEISESNISDNRLTGFDKDIYVQARKDNLRNKKIYDALGEASFGVKINADTTVDDIMEGRNKNVSARQLYNNFSKTRSKLRKKYGDEITLYRVESRQKAKATKNYGSSYKYTQQYGPNVQKYKVRVKDIVGIWTNRKGTYEDVIVATNGIEKYLK